MPFGQQRLLHVWIMEIEPHQNAWVAESSSGKNGLLERLEAVAYVQTSGLEGD